MWRSVLGMARDGKETGSLHITMQIKASLCIEKNPPNPTQNPSQKNPQLDIDQ